MNASSKPYNETERISALYQLQILDTAGEEDFDDLVALAVQVCEVSICTIAFLDEQRYWLKAVKGLNLTEIPTDTFFIKNTDQANIIIISDTLKDERFYNSPLVTGEPGIRFFAAVPLINEDGFTLGHFCIMDKKARSLSELQISGLRMLGKQVMALLKLRSQTLKIKKSEEEAISGEDLMSTVFYVGSSRVDLQACKLEYSIVSPK